MKILLKAKTKTNSSADILPICLKNSRWLTSAQKKEGVSHCCSLKSHSSKMLWNNFILATIYPSQRKVSPEKLNVLMYYMAIVNIQKLGQNIYHRSVYYNTRRTDHTKGILHQIADFKFCVVSQI